MTKFYGYVNVDGNLWLLRWLRKNENQVSYLKYGVLLFVWWSMFMGFWRRPEDTRWWEWSHGLHVLKKWIQFIDRAKKFLWWSAFCESFCIFDFNFEGYAADELNWGWVFNLDYSWLLWIEVGNWIQQRFRDEYLHDTGCIQVYRFRMSVFGNRSWYEIETSLSGAE
jgi:hypothetical protein